MKTVSKLMQKKGWKTVKKRDSGKKQPTNQSECQHDSDESMECESLQETHPSTSNLNSNEKSTTIAAQEQNKKEDKEESKPPPINIAGNTIKYITALLEKNGFDAKMFRFKDSLANSNNPTLYVKTQEIYTKVVTILKNNNIKIYTFTLKMMDPSNSNYSNNSLKIISINVNSLVSNQKRSSLLNFLVKHKPDIVLICETKLTKKHKIEFKDYNFIRNDRPNSILGGGTAILIRKPIKFKIINLNFRSLETTSVKISLSYSANLILTSAYVSGPKYSTFTPDISDLFNKLKLNDLNNYYIIAGDLNAKHTTWSNPENSPRGILLNTWIENNDLLYRTKLLWSEEPSYPSGGSYIDLFLSDSRIIHNDNSTSCRLKKLPYDSDHTAVQSIIRIDNNDLSNLEAELLQPRYNYQKAKWQKFQKFLRKKCVLSIPVDKNLSNEEIDSYLEIINTNISQGIDASIPVIKPRNSCECYINDKIKKLQKYKSFLITQINKLKHSNERNELSDEQIYDLQSLLSAAKEKIKIEFSASVNTYWEKNIRSIPPSDSSVTFPMITKYSYLKKIS